MVRFSIDPREGRLLVRGHAGFGQPGADPVCAGVSVLVLTLCRCVEELGERGQVSIQALAAEPGAAQIRCRSLPGSERELEVLFGAAATGLRLLAKEYGSFVKEVPFPEEAV